MLDLEDALGTVGAEQSLLLCYSASLTHVEHALLHRLQREGVGRVTLVIDPRGYSDTFAEATAVTGPGVDYHLAAVHLPTAFAAFHPKLYMLFHEAGGTLFVTSANLTLPGCRRNAEVVDRLDLFTDGTGDARALRQYAGFLNDLVVLDPSLPSAIRDEITGAAERIRALLPAEVPQTGPEFLHTLEAPLLEQIVARVRREDVQEIVAVSPFFDQQSAALRQLAEAYPDAVLHLHRRPASDNEIHGGALRTLKQRLRVYNFVLDDPGPARPLHAKWVLLRGRTGGWLVTGSANLSAPAWLHSALDGGNVEAVTFRVLEDPTMCAPLLAALAGSEVQDWERLRPQRRPDESPSAAPAFRVPEVRLAGNRIEALVLYLDAASATAEYTIEFPPPLGMYPLVRVGAIPDSAALRAYDCEAPEAVLHAETPWAVAVRARTDEGESAPVRVWLHRPVTLERDADERALRRALRSVERRGMWAEAGDLLRVGDLLARLASQVAEIQAASLTAAAAIGEGSRGGAGGGADTRVPSERWVAGITPGEGGTPGGTSSTSEPGALLERIVAGLRAAWRGQLDSEDGESRGDLRRPDDTTADREADDEPTVEVIPPLRASDVRALVKRLWEIGEEITPPPNAPVEISARARLTLALADFAFFLYLRLGSNEADQQQEVLAFLRHWFHRAFALDGFALGAPHGWMAQAWMHPATREETVRVWSSRATSVPIAALLGATLALPCSDPDWTAGAEAALLTGFQFVSGVRTERHTEGWMDALREYARAIATSPGAPHADAILEELLTPARGPAPLLRLAAAWAPLIARQEGKLHYRAAGDITAPPQPVQRTFERLLARRPPAVAPLFIGASGQLCCGGCSVALPTADAETALRAAEVQQCQQCSRFLLPFDFRSPHVGAVIDMLLATPEAERV